MKNAIAMKHHANHVVAHGETATIGNRRYIFGSAASYALQYNDCPVEAYNRAIENGHETHWANLIAAVLTSEGRAPEPTKHDISIDDVVYFEGRLFAVKPANNSNVTLEPLPIDQFEI